MLGASEPRHALPAAGRLRQPPSAPAAAPPPSVVAAQAEFDWSSARTVTPRPGTTTRVQPLPARRPGRVSVQPPLPMFRPPTAAVRWPEQPPPSVISSKGNR
ncbi:hypothetical protein AAHA92_24759 [Salvia divinorum]|uniref:Uncharacterized protein n=1 Tax=Salvia divinorum TaxID=28513 RepID=A0ABD1G8K0_SALDI